jgi:hypothetical protein
VPLECLSYIAATGFDPAKMGLGRIHCQFNIIHPNVGNGFDFVKYRIYRKIHGAESHKK